MLGMQDLIVLFYTVLVTREELYKVGLLGFFFLSCGFVIFIISLFLLPHEMIKHIFESALLLVGAVCVYIGWQLRVIEMIGKEFLERHMGAEIFQEHDRRTKNVVYVTPVKRELFEMKRSKGLGDLPK